MVKGIQNTFNIVRRTTTEAVKKAEYLDQGTILATSARNTNVIDITTKTSEKIKRLISKYSTEKIELNFEGVNREVTLFKGSGAKNGSWVSSSKTGKLAYIQEGFWPLEDAYSAKVASELYRTTGASVPNVSVYARSIGKSNYTRGTLTPYVPIEDVRPQYAKRIRESFATDCWLGNYDAYKKGNIGIHNGEIVRVNVSNSLRRTSSKGGFSEDVIELTSFFDDPSSKQYLKDMTREELLTSLKKVTSVADDDIIKIIKDEPKIIGRENLKERLIARKTYLENFLQKCESSPLKNGETVEAYIRRITGEMPKTQYKIPFENFYLSSRVGNRVEGITLADGLAPSQKKVYERAYHAFKSSKAKQIYHPNTDNILTSDCMIHGTSSDEAFESILKKGLLGPACEWNIHKSRPKHMETKTPLCADLWDIDGNTSIYDYFRRPDTNPEFGWLYNAKGSHTREGRYAIVFRKSAVDKDLMSTSFRTLEDANSPVAQILGKDDLITGTYQRHRVVPIGVPANAIDRIIIRADNENISYVIEKIKASGLDIKLYNTDGKLLWKPTPKVVSSFIEYGKKGVPLKYSRSEFCKEVWDFIEKEVPKEFRDTFLARFNLTAGFNGVLDGVPVIKGFRPQTRTEQKMLAIIEKFYQNEVDSAVNPETKIFLDKILKKHPEFAMMIGKVQHNRHSYSVDIHTLELLRKAMKDENYSVLSKEGKNILQHAAIMHDYGKMGGVVTSGQAKLSRQYAKKVLEAYDDIPQEMKNRILNLIENHHWFEAYNKNQLTPDQFAKNFPSIEDRLIAMILAKADFESVNPTFHLERLITGQCLTQEQFNKSFEAIMKSIIKFGPAT